MFTRIQAQVLGALGVVVVLGALTLFLVPASEPAPAPVAQPVPEVVDMPEEVPFVTHQVVGTSREGRTIEVYTYGTGTRDILLVGGIHGGYEWNSVLLAYEMMDYFEAHPTAIPADVTVHIVPVLNPDGLAQVVSGEGRFTPDAVRTDVPLGTGRFNAAGVDLNRNFGCKWQPESSWRGTRVSAGTAAFSEPEAAALREYVLAHMPESVVFWHSKAGAVFASECHEGVLPETKTLMQTYADAAGYKPILTFDAYPVTGDAEGWLASIGIPAITVEFHTHESMDWAENLAGVTALLARP